MHRTPRSSTPKSFRDAFTLIELLVVIAIIAVLATLTVPAVSGAIASSKSAKCLANLRQIGVAMIGYTSENGGRFPCDTSGSKSWGDYLVPYFPLSKTNSGYVKDLVYRCPAETNLPPAGFAKSVNHYIATYTLYQPKQDGTGISQTNGGRSTAAVESPSKTLLVVDGRPRNNSGYNCNTACTFSAYEGDCKLTPSNTGYVTFRHKNESMNAVYVDGHVSTILWTNRTDVTKAMWEGRGY